MKSIVVFLFAIIASCGLQAQVQKAVDSKKTNLTLETQGASAPRMFLVSRESDKLDKNWLELCLSPGWVDRKILLLPISKGSPQESLLLPFLKQLEQQELQRFESYWVLASRDRAIGLQAGHHPPSWEALQQTLEAHWGPSPLTTTIAFLRVRKDHWPARRDLLNLLLRYLPLQLRPLPPAEGDLPPGLDAAVWGPLATHLDAALGCPDWAVTESLRMDALLPPDFPEKHSPLMRAIYGKHRPQILAWLEEDPENLALWSALVRMNGVLDKARWPTLPKPGVASDASVKLYSFVRYGKAILRWGQAADQMGEAARVLKWMWSSNAAPALEEPLWERMVKQIPFHAKLPLGSDPLEMEKAKIWDGLLEPLLKALVQSGQAEAAQAVIQPMTGVQAGIVTTARLKTLLTEIHRLDLLATLRVNAEDTVAQARLPLPTLPGRSRVLVHQGQPEPAATLRDLSSGLVRRGFLVQVEMDPLPPEQAKLLDWIPGNPTWALLGKNGVPLLTGGPLPHRDALLQLLDAQGLQSDQERLRTDHRDHPGHLMTAARLADICSLQFASLEQSMRSDHPSSQAQTQMEVQACLAEWAASLAVILDSPLGMTQNLVVRSGLGFMGRAREGPRTLLQQDLSRRFLSRIEADLYRRPEDVFLWNLWLVLQDPSTTKPTDLLDALAPSPMLPDPLQWPPRQVLWRVSSHLQELSRWQEVIDLLQPKWSRIVLESRRTASRKAWEEAECWDASLTRSLLESLLRRGRRTEAEALVQDCQALGVQEASLQGLMGLLKGL